MPVRETDKRKQELQRQVDRRDLLVKALRDQDWIERLTNSDDFKKYLVRIGEAQKLTGEQRAQIVEDLSGALPLRKEVGGRVAVLTREELNEQLVVISTALTTMTECVGWPAAQEKRLADARKELPEVESRIKDLKGEN